MSCCENEMTNAAMIAGMRVGYAYVPIQTLSRVYNCETAMAKGTLFPELDISIGEYERGLYDGK